MASYYELDRFLSLEQEKNLLNIAINAKHWMEWSSTESGKYTPLKFHDPNIIFLDRKCWIMKLYPNEIVKEHTDASFRNTVLIYPLTKNYAPVKTIDGYVDKPALINTQLLHSVNNNNNLRINLQILFDENLDESFKIFNSRTSNELLPSKL